MSDGRFTITVSREERDAILAALRLYQQVDEAEMLPDEICDIATDGGSHNGMVTAHIDELCEKINIEADVSREAAP